MFPPGLMVFAIVLSFVNHYNCYNYGQRAKGLVYYPPYSDPFTDENNNPCAQFYEWKLAPQESYEAPKLDKHGNCRGSVNGLTFFAPQPVASSPPLSAVNTNEDDNEAIEYYVVDLSSNNKDGKDDFSAGDDDISRLAGRVLSFTCRDRQGLVRSASLYFWTYQYRFRGIVKSHSYQTLMPWNTEGKMLFHPLEPRPANITCHYYDTARGYFVPVRTWRLTFGRRSQTSSNSTTVKIASCQSELAELNSSPSNEFDILVTSNRLELPAFCPVSTCSNRLNNTSKDFTEIDHESLLINYEPALPKFCESNPADPASYSTCTIDPLKVSQLSYKCTPSQSHNTTKKQLVGSVKINIRSSIRFAVDADFKPLNFQEDDLDRTLTCSIDPETSPQIEPVWQRFDQKIDQYQDIIGDEVFKVVNDSSTGQHRLIIQSVKLGHEGSYRCVVVQSSVAGTGSQPIYGYYFIKVHAKPTTTALPPTSTTTSDEPKTFSTSSGGTTTEPNNSTITTSTNNSSTGSIVVIELTNNNEEMFEHGNAMRLTMSSDESNLSNTSLPKVHVNTTGRIIQEESSARISLCLVNGAVNWNCTRWWNWVIVLFGLIFAGLVTSVIIYFSCHRRWGNKRRQGGYKFFVDNAHQDLNKCNCEEDMAILQSWKESHGDFLLVEQIRYMPTSEMIHSKGQSDNSDETIINNNNGSDGIIKEGGDSTTDEAINQP